MIIGEYDPGIESKQTAISNAEKGLWDAAVIGAGPAGGIAALHLAAKGHSVLLLDRKRFPREKVCGDGLIADSLGALERAGLKQAVTERGYSTTKGSVYSPSRIEMTVPGEYITLRRIVLDTIITNVAVDKGAVFVRGDVGEFETEPDGSVTITLRNEAKKIRARTALVATGCSLNLIKKHGMVRRRRPSAVAIRRYVRSLEEIDTMIVSFDRSIVPGYCWVFPMKDNWYNVGCGVAFRNSPRDKVDLKHLYRTFAHEFPPMKEIMASLEEQTPLRGAPLRTGLQGAEPVGPGNVLAIGETVGTTFPFTGEGIGKAMETAEIAAGTVHKALESGDFSAYKNFARLLNDRLSDKYIGYKIAENWLAMPWLNDFVTKRVNASRYLHDAIIGVITETVDPRTVFSLKGILASFFK